MDVTTVLPVLILGGIAVLGALAGKLLGAGQRPPPERIPVPVRTQRPRR
jgi:hypothetical protein